MNKNSKALSLAISQIERAFGKGAIMRLGDKSVDSSVEVYKSGSIALDLALGVGGFARGRIIEIYGPESSGKTTLTLHAIANAQKAGGVCAFIDAEHALDPIYAKKLGINVDELIICQPDNGEQALEIADTLVRSNEINLIVIDSVAALVPKAELEGEMGDSHMGLQARLMSQALRKLTGSVYKSGCMVIFINQIRQKIGVMFGSNETTTGGNALKFYASIRLDIRRIGAIKDKDNIIGNQTRVKVVKNKLAPPFKVVDFEIMYGEGICKFGELIDLGVRCNLIEKSGSWYGYKGVNAELKLEDIKLNGKGLTKELQAKLKLEHKMGQGKEAAKQFLRENAEIADYIELCIRAHFKEQGVKEDDLNTTDEKLHDIEDEVDALSE